MKKKQPIRHCFIRFDLEKILSQAEGKTLGEVDRAHVFEKTKTHRKVTGIAGDVVEQSLLGYPADSRQEPDLIVDDVPVELKTTGLRRVSKGEGLEAKEYMSLTAVSPEKIVDEEFESSAFWHKVHRMLLVYYLYDSDEIVSASEYRKFPIQGYQFHTYEGTEAEVLRHDWQLVQDYLRKAQEESKTEEELHERWRAMSSVLRKDLVLIDIAPKYPNRPRFRLKRSEVTSIARKRFGEHLEELPAMRRCDTFASLDGVLRELRLKYAGMTMGQLYQEFGLSLRLGKDGKEAKNSVEPLIIRMLGGKGNKMNEVDFFARAGVAGKSVVLTKKGRGTEDTKLFSLDFAELENPCVSFEDSSFYEYFATHQLLLVVFEEPSHKAPLRDIVFRGFARIGFSDEFIENEVKKTWTRIRYLLQTKTLQSEPIFNKQTGQPRMTRSGVVMERVNLPKSAEGEVFIRGTGTDATKKPWVIQGVRMYHQDVWLSRAYIVKRMKGSDLI